MDAASLLFQGFADLFTPAALLAALAGCLMGTIVGILPGLGPSTTIALLIPVALNMDPGVALVMMTAIYLGAMYGGTLTSVLMNVPGEASSVMTALDGYQMARQGKAGTALAISAIGSFIGGTLSVVGLMLLALPLANVALAFGPSEYFAVVVMALLLCATLAAKSVLKGLISISIGLALATVGTDLQSGVARFTFDQSYLLSGIDVIVPIIGLFGVGEVLWNIRHPGESGERRLSISGRLWPSRPDLLRSGMPILRGSIIGFIAGLLPGSGSTLGSLTAYSTERRVSKSPDRFGRGAIEGVATAETANNSATGGALIPMLTLGIPGSGTTAVLLAYFVMYGIDPGPQFFSENADLAWLIIASLYFSNVVLLLLNLPLIPLFVKILDVPVRFIYPIIMVVAFIGGFAVTNSVFNAMLVFAFGVLGYAMRYAGLSPVLLIIALVLGGMMERDFRQALLLNNNDVLAVLTTPLSLVFLGIGLLVVGLDVARTYRQSRSGHKE